MAISSKLCGVYVQILGKLRVGLEKDRKMEYSTKYYECVRN
jgi:hypothetical protein